MHRLRKSHVIDTSWAAVVIVGGAYAHDGDEGCGGSPLRKPVLTLQHRNSLVKVSAICPALVRTNIANAERNSPAELRNEPVAITPGMQAGLAAFKAAMEVSVPPLEVAEVVFDAT